MDSFHQVIIFLWSLFSFAGLLVGLYQTTRRRNSFGLVGIFNLLGAFVWGDLVVFSIFWLVMSIVVLFFKSWYLFLLTQSLFWLTRSLGEMIYWLNQQFSSHTGNPPQQYWFFSIFGNESVWFVHQILWQCISVVSIIASLYFAKLWLGTL